MNNTIIPVVLALLVGIGIGWVAKATGQSDQQTAASQTENSPKAAQSSTESQTPQPALSSPPGPSKSGPRPQPVGQAEPGEMPWNAPAPGEGAAVFGGVFEEPAVDVEEERRQMIEHHREVHAEQIAALASALNLTAEQQDQLRTEHFDPLAESRASRFYPQEDQDVSPEPASLASVLGEVLTEEQKTTYEEFRVSQRRQFIEAETLEELAGLTFLDLSPEQRDTVYDQIFRETETDMAEHDNRGALIGAAAGALGGAIIGNNVGDENAGRGAIIGAGLGVAAEEFEAAAEQRRQAAIRKELDRFRAILTPEQIETYRRQLERAHSGNVYEPLNPHLPPLNE